MGVECSRGEAAIHGDNIRVKIYKLFYYKQLHKSASPEIAGGEEDKLGPGKGPKPVRTKTCPTLPGIRPPAETGLQDCTVQS